LNMNLHNVGTIFKKELTDTMRDRRTLIFMLMVPVIDIPILMIFTSSLMISSVTKIQKERATIVLEGADNLPADLRNSLFNSELLAIKTDAEFVGRDLIAALQAGEFQALVSIPDKFAQALEMESSTSVEIFFDAAEAQSESAVDKIKDILIPYREHLVSDRLSGRGMSSEILKPFEISSRNMASIQKVAGSKLGAMLPYLIIIMCFMGAMYPAIDLAAGEKERGTLETLLVSPASRGEFVLGKYLVILLTGTVAALLAMASMTFSINHMASNLFKDLATEIFTIQFNADAVLLIIMIVLPLAGIFAGILLSISIFARSFKEAQSYITAMNMFVILPSFIGFIPGLKLNLKMALIPVVNVSLIIKEAISGTVQWPLVVVAFVSTLLLAALSLYFSKKWFEREEVLFRM